MNTDSDPPTPTIFVIDDDLEIRTLLEHVLNRVGYRVATFADAREFLKRPCFDGLGCLVLDIQMPEMNGLDLQKHLAKTGKGLPIIFFTGHGDIRTSVEAMKQGAVDFLTKPFNREEFLEAVEVALNKHRQWRQAAAETEEVCKRISTLTPREREVMSGVTTGKLNKQIADELGISEITVKVHRSRVMKKMGVTSVADLVRSAERRGDKTGELS